MMTLEQIYEKINEASNKIVDLRNELDRKEKLLKAGKDVDGDGVVDEKDKAAVADVRKRHDAMQKICDDLLDEHTRIEQANGGDPNAVEMEELEVVGINHRKTFAQDRAVFVNQIKDWRDSLKEELARLVNSMLSDSSSPPTLSGKDAIAVATSVLSPIPGPLKTGIGVATLLTDIAKKHFNSLQEPKPTLRQVEKQWRDSLDLITAAEAGKMYDALCETFRKNNGMEPNEEFVYHTYEKDWDAMIYAFQEGQGLPSKDTVNRPFMKLAIESMPDDWDFGSDVGSIQVYMTFDLKTNKFAFTSGSIDDLSAEVKSGLNADPGMFGKDQVHYMPCEISISVGEPGTFGGTYCHIQRNAKKSGDTGFKVVTMPIGSAASMEEQGTLFKIFMQRKAYEMVPISKIL